MFTDLSNPSVYHTLVQRAGKDRHIVGLYKGDTLIFLDTKPFRTHGEAASCARDLLAMISAVRDGRPVQPVRLGDGLALQSLIEGERPDAMRAAFAALRARRNARRTHAAPPAGGLFDDVARAQGSLL